MSGYSYGDSHARKFSSRQTEVVGCVSINAHLVLNELKGPILLSKNRWDLNQKYKISFKFYEKSNEIKPVLSFSMIFRIRIHMK